MSSDLYWRPPNPEGAYLGYELKFILREQFGGGTLSEWTQVDKADVSFLEGVIVGSGKHTTVGKGARELIELIEKHGSVEVREQS